MRPREHFEAAMAAVRNPQERRFYVLRIREAREIRGDVRSGEPAAR
jgi:hypothetical protein